MDDDTGERFKIYLVQVRASEALFASLLHGDAAMQTTWETLFTLGGKRIHADIVRQVIADTMKSSGYPIQFNDLRHHAAGMVPIVSGTKMTTLIDQLLQEVQDTGHEQAGHSSGVAQRNYATTNSQLPSLTRSDLQKFKQWSHLWHTSMGLKSSSLPHTTPCPELPQTTILPPPQQLLPAQTTSLLQTIANGMSSLIRGKRSALKDPTDTPVAKRTALYVSQTRVPIPRNSDADATFLLPKLRDATRNPQALFKSHMQLSVTASVLSNSDNLLVIMPTGAGKTMCALLPAFIEGAQKSTIILVPLVALTNEYKIRCKDLGISMATWESRDSLAQAYVFSSDTARNEDLEEFVRSLADKRILSRFVIDEAQVTSMCDDFPPSLRLVQHLLLQVPSTIPRILLSATIPPRDRARVICMHGMSSAAVYTTSTVRKNLQFSAKEVTRDAISDSRFHTDEEVIAAALTTELTNIVPNLRRNQEPSRPLRIIVFAMTRTFAADLSSYLTKHTDHQVLCYHAALPESNREAVHNMWTEGTSNVIVMVCTSAFGTGVDTRDVRLIYHLGAIRSLCDVAQECGRAGRDNETAYCRVLYKQRFITSFGRFLSNREDGAAFTSEDDMQLKILRWNEAVAWIVDKDSCRKNALYTAMDGEGPGLCSFDADSENCDVCADRIGSTSFINTSATPRPTSPAVPQTLITRTPFQAQQAQQAATRPQPAAITDPVPRRSPLTPPPPPSPQQHQQLTNHPPRPSRQEAHEERYLLKSNAAPSPEPLASIAPALPQRSEGVKIAGQIREIARSLDKCCVCCLLILKKRKSSAHRCYHQKSRCKRCFAEGHSVAHCTITRRKQNHCFKCSLGYVLGENIHANTGFGPCCTLFICKDLCWALWNISEDIRSDILLDLFGPVEMAQYHAAKAANHTSAILGTIFETWLLSESPSVPNMVKLLLWWGRREGIITT